MDTHGQQHFVPILGVNSEVWSKLVDFLRKVALDVSTLRVEEFVGWIRSTEG